MTAFEAVHFLIVLILRLSAVETFQEMVHMLRHTNPFEPRKVDSSESSDVDTDDADGRNVGPDIDDFLWTNKLDHPDSPNLNEWPKSVEPEFAAPMRNVTVPIGKEAKLTCIVDSLGKHKVAWVRAEDQTVLSLQTKVITHNARISVTHDNMRIWQLHIRHVKESDRGCYMCQINTNTIKIEKGCVDVNVPPDIMDDDTSGDLSAAEGENATLWCRATGHPPPRISWKREDSQPITIRKGTREFTKADNYNGSSLYFWRLDRRQMGAYLCIASNDVPPAVSKRVSLYVNFAPAIKVPNQLLGAPLSTDVQLECYVEAFPNTINYWIKNRGEMLLNGTKYHIKEEKSTYKVLMWLLIIQFSEEDIGTYNCISTNSLGKAEGTLRLYEIKVSPGESLENGISIVGGLAEPARGHRSNDEGNFSAGCCKRALPFAVFTVAMSLLKIR